MCNSGRYYVAKVPISYSWCVCDSEPAELAERIVHFGVSRDDAIRVCERYSAAAELSSSSDAADG